MNLRLNDIVGKENHRSSSTENIMQNNRLVEKWENTYRSLIRMDMTSKYNINFVFDE